MAGKGKVQDKAPEDDEAEGDGAEGTDGAEGEGKGKGKKKVRKPAGPMTLVIVGAVALFVAVLGAQVAAPLLTKIIAGDPNAPADEAALEEEQLAVAEPEPESVAEEAPAEALEPAIYVPMDPPFVVSFSDEGGDTRFLQLTLQAMARNEHTIEAIKTHAPAIRNSFLFLISGYKVEDLATLEGKEKLRAAMLVAANEILAKNTGEDSTAIEELYFTSLVIQ